MSVVKECIIDLESRPLTGSKENRRLRKNGSIPAVLYHRGESSLNATLSEKQFVQYATRSNSTQLFTTRSAESTLNSRSLLVKEIQLDGLKGKVLHVDFQVLSDNEEIHLSVPLVLTGEAPGVKLDGGIINVVAYELEVSCLPRLIPESIAVDISELRLSQSIHAKAVKLPEGVTLKGDENQTIVTIVAAKAAEEAAVTPGAAAAEGATPAADGATPAAAAAPAAKK